MTALARRAVASFALLALVAGPSACSSTAAAGDEATSEGSIIRGQDAFDGALDAVARISTPSSTFCGATLVAPRLLLTAAHCTEGYDGMGHERPIEATFTHYDASGAVKSTKKFWAAGVLRFGAEKRPDLVFGIDMALVMLRDEVPAAVARPIPVRAKPLAQSDVGKTLLEVGYGQTAAVDPNFHAPEARQKGELTLNAVGGKPYEQMFESRAAFDAYLTQVEDARFAEERGDEIYATELSAYGQEVHAGGKVGGAQGCYGDSGGPLLEKVGDHYEVTAVVSRGPDGKKNTCIAGEIFVRASTQVIDAIRERASLADPVALVRCWDEAWASCSADGVLAACREGDPSYSAMSGGPTYKQRIERCADKGLTCTTVAGKADCR